MPNRLANETSPYLRQHENNPVDWFPWGEDAFARAKAEDKPVLLSVGYSSCHWCHVMAHESFENPEVAEILNAGFISVKVDREERPDVDQTFMVAVLLTTGRPGWPMTVFLTPDKKPFFAGTYFPREDVGERPGLLSVLRDLAHNWKTMREEFDKVGSEYVRAMLEFATHAEREEKVELYPETILACVQALAERADPNNGGFGTRPKFPPHTAIEFLLNFVARWNLYAPNLEEIGSTAVETAMTALYGMALGGIRDHIGGGFHRYSTDERWFVPHFEKMLYDNALALANYARAESLLGPVDPFFAGLARSSVTGIVAWLAREMTSPEGLFYSAQDADSEGEEGKYYVWTEGEVRDVLGRDADAFLRFYGFDRAGNYADETTGKRTGANIPHLDGSLGDLQEASLAKLLDARCRRVPPAVDDKALVGWNGLMIAGLAEAWYPELAERAASAILAAEKAHGGLPRQIAGGRAAGFAFLEDYAYLIWGLLALEDCTGKEFWGSEAARLTDEMISRFYDRDKAGFWDTSESHESLFGRTKTVFDQPIPSANAVAIRCLLRLNDLARAEESLVAFGGWLADESGGCDALALAAMEFLLLVVETEPMDSSTVPAVPAVAVVTDPRAEPSPAPRPNVAVSLSTSEIVADSSRWGTVDVIIDLPDGWHVNSHTPDAKWLVPTEVAVEPLRCEVSYPPARGLGYEARVRIPVRVQLPAGESGAEFEVSVSFQACTESECLQPESVTLSGVLIA